MERKHLLLRCTILLLCLLSCSYGEDWDVMPDSDIAGPVVKQSQAQDGANDKQPAAEAPASDKPKKTIAQMIDEALEQEFPKEAEGEMGKNFNETSKMEEASMETVLLVRSKAKEKPEDKNQNTTSSSSNSGTAALSSDGGNSTTPKPKPKIDTNVEKEVDRIIDSEDNEYVLSRPKERGLTLTLDPQLIRDLTILITSSATVGLGMEAMKQPVINGYFIAGALVGPGGMKWVKELVQVQSLAQLGVSLLLFALGLEFSMAKLRAVRGVALFGGLMEIVLMSILAGALAKLIGGRTHEGIFTGALVAMSSTSIVVKCLHDAKAMNSSVGQITVGTLILQDCMVGLMFAFMPLLSHASGQAEVDKLEIVTVVCRVTATLLLSLSVAMTIARVLLQPMVRLLANHASHELYQLSLVAFCLLCAMITGYLGLSTELGAFIAGVMLSTTDQQENAMHCIEPVKQMFVTLFISSTGLILSPTFLLQHLPVLTAGLLLVVVSKTLLFSFVVWLFGYNLNTCVAVGISMAQIGEFAFVLLSIARQMDMVQHQLYMLLMGVTAISLLITPSLLQIGRLLLSDHPITENGTSYTKLKHKRSSMVLELETDDDNSVAVPARDIPPPTSSGPNGSPLRNRHNVEMSAATAALSLGGLQQRNANV